MTLSNSQLAAALDAISEDIEEADSSHRKHHATDHYWALGNAEWRIELAYSKLLVLTEVL
jgi:hypothetical protein